MASPFPGMDPYLEGYLWPDVHHRFATQISDQLTPHLRPRYVARIEIQVVQDAAPEGEIGIMYPDVEIVQTRSQPTPPPMNYGGAGVLVAEAPTTPATISVPLTFVEVKLASVHIRDVAQNQLITSIEILSPVNKHEPGITKYREKRQNLHEAGVHLLEIDLLRRGQRPVNHPRIPASAYRVILTRAKSNVGTVWALQLLDALPVLPVPLRTPDADITLDLGLALRTIYERAAYDLSINYREAPPPPALSPEDTAWWQQRLEKATL
ncbi:MAG: DUF4058 family protein [Caldilineaceae bacterium]